MRSTDEQLRLIRQRADRLRRRRDARRKVLYSLSGVCVCLVLLTALVLTLPRVNGTLEPVAGSYGSLALSSPILGYVLVAVLAMALGTCVTMLCIRVAAMRKDRGGK